jgi:hypothetical protein
MTRLERIRLSKREQQTAQWIGTPYVLSAKLLILVLWRMKRWLMIFSLAFFVAYGYSNISASASEDKVILDHPVVKFTPTPTMTQLDKQASWIAEYAQKYARPEIGKSKSLVTYQLACLAHKENGFHSNDHCGDDGLACGEYQFHQATWVQFREDMIKEGLVSEVGSRLDDQQATETTAWAITHGHDNDWGPLLRGECQ